MESTDRIQRQVLLRSPVSRVWVALTDATEFGAWFGVKMDTGFAVGKPATGTITHPGYEHLRFEVHVDRLDVGRLFSFRWHPYAVDPEADYSKEPMTLVEFRLQEQDGGTLLTVVESGFDRIPAERRALAFRMNSGGWTAQTDNLRRHVEA